MVVSMESEGDLEFVAKESEEPSGTVCTFRGWLAFYRAELMMIADRKEKRAN
jgi:hypothetical protein